MIVRVEAARRELGSDVADRRFDDFAFEAMSPLLPGILLYLPEIFLSGMPIASR